MSRVEMFNPGKIYHVIKSIFAKVGSVLHLYMDILVTAATEFEIKGFMLDGLSKIDKKINLDIQITGIGIPSTLYELTRTLTHKKYDLVVQAGIAGTFTRKLPLGTVVLVEKDTFGELGILEEKTFTTLFESGLADGNVPPYQEGWLVNPDLAAGNKLQRVSGVTVSTVGDSQANFKRLKKTFAPAIESMEGAAFHYVCLQTNHPFIQLRSISNEVGERDKSKWDLKKSIDNLNKELLNLIQNV